MLRICTLLCLLALAAIGARAASDQKVPAEVQVVLRQLDAFNRHDADALADGVSEDFVWYSVTSDATTIESRGREKLREGMKSYFKSIQDVSSKIEGATAVGAFVSFRETASWTGKKGRRSQASLAVYEVHGGLITRVWYYPVAGEPAP